VDYRIDYRSGHLSLLRPLLSPQTAQHSVQLQITYQSEASSQPSSRITGARAEWTVGGPKASLRAGAGTVVHQPGQQLVTSDLSLAMPGIPELTLAYANLLPLQYTDLNEALRDPATSAYKLRLALGGERFILGGQLRHTGSSYSAYPLPGATGTARRETGLDLTWRPTKALRLRYDSETCEITPPSSPQKLERRNSLSADIVFPSLSISNSVSVASAQPELSSDAPNAMLRHHLEWRLFKRLALTAERVWLGAVSSQGDSRDWILDGTTGGGIRLGSPTNNVSVTYRQGDTRGRALALEAHLGAASAGRGAGPWLKLGASYQEDMPLPVWRPFDPTADPPPGPPLALVGVSLGWRSPETGTIWQGRATLSESDDNTYCSGELLLQGRLGTSLSYRLEGTWQPLLANQRRSAVWDRYTADGRLAYHPGATDRWSWLAGVKWRSEALLQDPSSGDPETGELPHQTGECWVEGIRRIGNRVSFALKTAAHYAQDTVAAPVPSRSETLSMLGQAGLQLHVTSSVRAFAYGRYLQEYESTEGFVGYSSGLMLELPTAAGSLVVEAGYRGLNNHTEGVLSWDEYRQGPYLRLGCAF